MSNKYLTRIYSKCYTRIYQQENKQKVTRSQEEKDMEKSMQEVLKENRENTRYQRCLIERARLERKELKENALTIFIISFIMFATITLMDKQ